MDDIAIIGAGMAGLSAARALIAAGRAVTVFDKSRGTGGRLATRRTDLGAFDHGAPAVHGSGIDGFAAAMQDLPTARQIEDGGWRGSPGMSGLLKPWLAGLDHRPGVQIERLDGRRAVDTEGEAYGPFNAVIVAIPAPQAHALTHHPALTDVTMAPVWTLLAAWADPVAMGDLQPPFETAYPQDPDGHRWVAHVDPAYSREMLERDKPAMAAELISPLGTSLGTDASPVHVAAHRWRFARTDTPLGAPFADCGDGVLAGGDWALGPLAGHAFASGRAMARAILSGDLSDGAPPR